MTAEPLRHPDEPGDRLADFESPAAADPQTAEDQRRRAQLQFLHAVLEVVHHPELARPDARVAGVMAQIRPPAAVPQPAGASFGVTRRQWSRAAAAAAALLVLGAGGVALWPTSSAEAAVRQAQRAAREAADRRYAVASVFRGAFGRRHPGRGDLYVRGVGEFVWRQPGLLGVGTLTLGRSGDEAWLVPARGAVVRARASEAYPWEREHSVATPYLQLTTILDRLGDDYAYEKLPPDELPELQGASRTVRFTRIVATPKAGDPRAPERIELWTDPATGVLRRLILTWSVPPRQGGFEEVQFDLASTDVQPADWYTPEPHAARRAEEREGKRKS